LDKTPQTSSGLGEKTSENGDAEIPNPRSYNHSAPIKQETSSLGSEGSPKDQELKTLSVASPFSLPEKEGNPVQGIPINSHKTDSSSKIRFEIPKKGESLKLSHPLNPNQEAQVLVQKRNEPLLEASLRLSWDKLIKYLEQKQNHQLYSILSPIQPEIGPDFMIRLPLQNLVQKTIILEESEELIHFLREELKNDYIHFEYLIRVLEAQNLPPFTAQDKLKHLSEINPILIKMKNQLGLDIDY
jgi:hypothetical protein